MVTGASLLKSSVPIFESVPRVVANGSSQDARSLPLAAPFLKSRNETSRCSNDNRSDPFRQSLCVTGSEATPDADPPSPPCLAPFRQNLPLIVRAFVRPGIVKIGLRRHQRLFDCGVQIIHRRRHPVTRVRRRPTNSASRETARRSHISPVRVRKIIGFGDDAAICEWIQRVFLMKMRHSKWSVSPRQP
jgi:hypothetical protein